MNAFGNGADAYDDVPDRMKTAKRWLLWKAVPDGEGKKPKKIPYYADGRPRESKLDCPDDWDRMVTFDEILVALRAGRYKGPGFALGPDGTGGCWQGIDLDNIADHFGLEFVAEDLPGYTDTSPSGRGRHAIGYGRPFPTLGPNSTGIEAYAAGRFFTVTGKDVGLGEVTCLAEFVASRLVRPHAPNDPSATPSVGGLQAALLAPDLKDALSVIPSDDRNVWVRIGMAVKGLGHVGETLWMEWSRTSEKFDEDEARRAWQSFKPDFIDYRAVFNEARRRGWKRSSQASDAAAPDHSKWARPFVWQDPTTLPPRRWIYKPAYIRSYVSLTVSGGGIGKSTLVITELLAIVTGQPLLGVAPSETGRAWYWNGEDPQDEIDRRIHAALIHHGIPPQEVEGRLFTGSGRDADLIIATQTRDGTVIAAPVVEEVIELIRANRIDVVVIDPFVSSHSVPENDNNAIDRVAKTWARIASQTCCAVKLVHHVRKTGGAEITVEDGRGAVALLAAARHARTLRPMSVEEAPSLGVEAEDRLSYVRVDSGKANMTKPAKKATWFQLANVHLGNGDEVQAASDWIAPDLLAGVTAQDCHRVQKIIDAGQPDGSGWRADVQTGEAWVGYAIAQAFGLDLANVRNRAIVKARLKMWMTSGALKTVRHAIGQKGKTVPFVEVGRWAER